MDLKGNNLMVDFETLDTKPGAILLSVGIVLFNQDDILRKGYSEFDYWKQKNSGRTTSKSTLAWWLRNNKDELNRLQREGKRDLEDWVKKTEVSLKESKPRVCWSRGYMDFIIMQELFGNRMFPFWKCRDVRTLDEFGIKQDKNQHNALGDCMNQVEYVRKVFSHFNKEKE